MDGGRSGRPGFVTDGTAAVPAGSAKVEAMSTSSYLHALAAVNRHGFGFLAAYGSTWLLAALAWRWRGERAGAYAALLQGMVALPIAFGLTAVTATGPRPDDPLLGSLSTYLAMGQLMVLPLVVVTIMAHRWTQASAMMAVTTAVHFLPYSWLYQTPVYVVMGVVLALAVATLVRLEARRETSSGALLCGATGVVLWVGAVACLAL